MIQAHPSLVANPAVANAVVWVIAQMTLKFFNHYSGPYTTTYVAGMLLVLLAFMVASVFMIFKVGALASDMFRGSGGQMAFPGFGWWRG